MIFNIFLYFSLLVLIVAELQLIFFVLPIILTKGGAPYIPSGEKEVDKIISLAKIKPGDRVVDLGSGDGRIVIGFAKQGTEAHGYEVNPILVLWSKLKILFSGL